MCASAPGTGWRRDFLLEGTWVDKLHKEPSARRGKLTAWSHTLRATSECVSLTSLHIKKQSVSLWSVQNKVLWMDSKVDAFDLSFSSG